MPDTTIKMKTIRHTTLPGLALIARPQWGHELALRLICRLQSGHAIMCEGSGGGVGSLDFESIM